jgi:hypothetical protein
MNRRRQGRSLVVISASVGIVVLFLAATAWSAVAPFDSAKMKKEIEVMKSILSTRLSFADDAREDKRGGTDNEFLSFEMFEAGGRPRVEGFYLFDQGVVFTVGLHGVTHRRSVDLASVEDRLERLQTAAAVDPNRLEMQLAMIENRLAESEALRAYAEAVALTELEFDTGAHPSPEVAPGPEPSEPPEPPEPPEAPEPPEPRYWRAQRSPEDREQHLREVKQRAVEMEQRLKEFQQQQQEEEQKVEQYRARVTEELILALANHGDSLTELKADEYINLILVEGEGSWFQLAGGPVGKPSGIFSVKKSDITQYRLGQITLDQFKSRVMTYE